MAYLQLIALSFALFSCELARGQNPPPPPNVGGGPLPLTSSLGAGAILTLPPAPVSNGAGGNRSPLPPPASGNLPPAPPVSNGNRSPLPPPASGNLPPAPPVSNGNRSPLPPPASGNLPPSSPVNIASAGHSFSPLPKPSRAPSSMPPANSPGKPASVATQTSATLLANKRLDFVDTSSQSTVWVWALVGVLSPTLLAFAVGLWHHQQQATSSQATALV